MGMKDGCGAVSYNSHLLFLAMERIYIYIYRIEKIDACYTFQSFTV